MVEDIGHHRPSNLEELFFGKDYLYGYEILEFLRRMRPDQTSSERLSQAKLIAAIFDGWKEGIFFVDGDSVGMREWQRN